MRHHVLAALLLFEVAYIATASSVEDGDGTVFDLGNLVDEAEHLSHGITVKTAGETALARVQAMKDALSKKMLSDELVKLPYTEQELGEGAAVQSVRQQQGTVQKALANAHKHIVERLRAKLMHEEKKELTAERDEEIMKVERNEAREKEEPKGMGKEMTDLQNKVAALKDELDQQKKLRDGARKRYEKDLAAQKAAAQKQRNDIKAEEQKVIELNREKAKVFVSKVKKEEREESAQLANVTKAKAELENKLKDVNEKIVDSKDEIKETKIGLKAEFDSEKRDLIEKETEEVEAAKNTAAGEKQKAEWTKEKAHEAEVQAEKAQGKVLKEEEKAQEQQAVANTASKKLNDEEKKLTTEEAASTQKVNNLKLKDALEQVEADRAISKVNSTKAELALKYEEQKSTLERVTEAKQEAATEAVKKTERKMSKLKAEEKTEVAVIHAKEQEQRELERLESNKATIKAVNRVQEVESSEQRERIKMAELEEKVDDEKEQLAREKFSEKDQKTQSLTQLEGLKETVKDDATRIQKRAGLRTVTVAQKQELETVELKLKQTEGARATAEKRELELADKEDADTTKLSNLNEKLKREEYKNFMAKKEARDAKVALKLEKVKEEYAKEHPGKIFEATPEEKQLANDNEQQLKASIKANEALKVKLSQTETQSDLSYTKNQKFEAEAQQLKQKLVAAAQHSRRQAQRIRKEWGEKLIKQQTDHVKEVMSLKRLIGTSQAKSEVVREKLEDKAAKLARRATKMKAVAGNEGLMTKYVSDELAQQQVKTNVLQKYMAKSQKTEQKYNQNLMEENQKTIDKLKKKINAYENGKQVAGLMYQIEELKRTQTQKLRQATIKMDVRRTQALDVNTLMSSAIKEAQKGSAGLSEAENRKRVDAAVLAVTDLVQAKDRREGKALADGAISASGKPSAPDGPMDPQAKAYIGALQRQNDKLKAQMSRLRLQESRQGASQEELIASALETEKEAVEAAGAVEAEKRVVNSLPDGPKKERSKAILKQNQEQAAAKAHAVVLLKQSALMAEPKSSRQGAEAKFTKAQDAYKKMKFSFSMMPEGRIKTAAAVKLAKLQAAAERANPDGQTREERQKMISSTATRSPQQLEKMQVKIEGMPQGAAREYAKAELHDAQKKFAADRIAHKAAFERKIDHDKRGINALPPGKERDTRLAALAHDEKVEDRKRHGFTGPGAALTDQQKTLMGKLDSLIKLDQAKDSVTAMTDSVPLDSVELREGPQVTPLPHTETFDDQLGELRHDALLVPTR